MIFIASLYFTSEASNAGVKLYVFDCGMLRFPDIEAFGIKNDETDIRELIVPCYIIEHDKGRLLWDGGLPSVTAHHDGWDDNGAKMDRTFAGQIEALNLNMASFDYVAFSHMHYDHVGIANEISGATLLIQKPEYDAAFADKVTIPFFDPSLYNNLKTGDIQILNGDHDVFGDGTVRIISAYGHTPGHQVLFIDLANYGPLVLSGDLYHFQISRRERRVPEFNFDVSMTLKAMDKVEKFVSEHNAKFWIQHDLAAFKTLKKAPDYYD